MVTKKEYSEMSKKASPNSKSWVNVPVAFLIGGAICTLGEIFLNIFSKFGFEKEGDDRRMMEIGGEYFDGEHWGLVL